MNITAANDKILGQALGFLRLGVEDIFTVLLIVQRSKV